MPVTNYRASRVAELIQAAISRILIEEFQDAASGFITVVRVEVTRDLRTARIHLSTYGSAEPAAFLDRLEKRKGQIRKNLASLVRLKYNPELIFVQDEIPAYQERIDNIIENAKKKNK